MRERARIGQRRQLLGAAMVALLVAGSPTLASGHHENLVNKLEAGITERVSVSSSGEQADGPSGEAYGGTCAFVGTERDYAASDNGRYIAFASAAGNLHPADINGKLIVDIFRYDRKTNKMDLVSVLPTGLSFRPPASAPTSDCTLQNLTPAISGNGRYVAFVSNVPLVGGAELAPSELVYQVFLYDAKKKSTEIVSQTWDGSAPVFGATASTDASIGSGLNGIAINDNGRYVVFTSDATNMTQDSCSGTTPETGNCGQVYVRDRTAKRTSLVSKSTSGDVAASLARFPSISGQGQHIVFQSAADNLESGDLNQCASLGSSPPGCPDVFLHNLTTKKTELISVSRAGSSANDVSGGETRWVSGLNNISDDGRFVVFGSYATDLVPANPPLPRAVAGASATYLRDRKEDRTERISVTSAGTMMRDSAHYPSITDDGRYVMVELGLSVTDCPAGCDHVFGGHFIHDRETGQVDGVAAPAPRPSDPHPPGTEIRVPQLGGNGSFLVGIAGWPLDRDDTNSVNDIFVRTFLARGLGSVPLHGERKAPEGLLTTAGPGASRTSAISYRDNGSDARLPGRGSEIIHVSVTHRPDLDDLFVRLDLDRLANLGVPLVYGVGFTVDGIAYQARARGVGGPAIAGGGTFDLLRCEAGSCGTKIASLLGGFGTVGENVVMSIPLARLGADAVRIGEIGAFTGLDMPIPSSNELIILDRALGTSRR